MNHKIKTLLFKTIALLPNKLDDYCYHKIQSFFDKSTLESRLKSVESTYLRLSKVLKELNVDLKNKTIFEIGSGWFPAMPYFFKYNFNSKDVVTVDINKHFKRKTVLKINSLFSKKYNFEIKPASDNSFGLPENVRYLPNYDVTKQDFPETDFIFSRYVLSHMSEQDVDLMHEKMKKQLKKDSLVVHFISPSDLRQHGDNSLALQDFLQYSKQEWDKIRTKFDYHNRLRLPQFIEIFNKYGYEILHLDYESLKQGTERYDLFKKVKIHKDFIQYSDEELTAGNIMIVLKV